MCLLFYINSILRGETQFESTNNTSYIVFFDIDQFKAFNDNHGHLVGDEILIQTAMRVEKVISSNGTIIRYGGDEFVVILNIKDSKTIKTWINKMKNQVSRPIYLDGLTYNVTCSFGYSMFDLNYRKLEKAIRLSDLDMYQKKQAIH